MATYTLNVVIDNAILALHSKDSLCISKKVSPIPRSGLERGAPG
jgi:hypothetical protein